LATSIIGTSGIIHYADSVEVYSGLPHEVKEVLKEAPAAWDETRCLKGDPGKVVVLARRSGKKWFVAGLNGTDRIMPVALDLKKLGNIRKVLEISEGQDPIMQFSTKNTDVNSKWQHKMPKFGGFVLCVDAED
jgi:hypothetical protein